MTVIGKSIIVRGRLSTEEDLVVHGRIDAEVRSTRAVRVEVSGVVNANMDVHSAAIDGILVGNVRANEVVELLPNARVVGDVTTPRLIVHEGARLRGRVDMDGLQTLEILKRSPVQAPTAQVRRPIAPVSPRISVDPPRAFRAEVVEWEDPEALDGGPIRAPAAARVAVEPFAARVPVDPAAVKVDYRPPRPEGPVPAKLEPAAPPSRPRPAAAPTPKPSDKTPVDAPEKGGWFRGRH